MKNVKTGMGQFGDAVSTINQLIRHDTFDWSGFYAFL